jgi:hypothetical protein
MSIIVSAYFKIPSKAPHEFYIPHITRFLKYIKNPIIFFTTPDLKQEFEILRGDLPIHFILINSIYDINAFIKYGYNFWLNQCKIDVEKYHTPELCALWYEKKEFVKKAILFVDNIDINDNKYNLNTNIPFIWCDAGCVRSNDWIHMIKSFGNKINVIPKDKLMFQLINKIPNKDFFVYPDNYIAGAIICGYKDSWINYTDLYDKMITNYVNNNICVNSDQYIWVSVILKNPDYFQLCKYYEFYNIIYNKIDKWFFLLGYLSY